MQRKLWRRGWFETQGHEGLVLAGTTGESPTLTHDEQGQLFRAVREAVNVPIIAGTGSNDTRARGGSDQTSRIGWRRWPSRGHAVLQPTVAGCIG